MTGGVRPVRDIIEKVNEEELIIRDSYARDFVNKSWLTAMWD